MSANLQFIDCVQKNENRVALYRIMKKTAESQNLMQKIKEMMGFWI